MLVMQRYLKGNTGFQLLETFQLVNDNAKTLSMNVSIIKTAMFTPSIGYMSKLASFHDF